MTDAPGRHCPISYRYGAGALARETAFETETLWVAGGLYGNRYALSALLEAYASEPGAKALVFNGDFHWFDCEPREFQQLDEAISRHRATRGNVETELAAPSAGAGCGCGYPDWIGDAEVQRSNRILERLRGVAAQVPAAVARLAALPMYALAAVGGERVAVVHGDADSLSGWGFSRERLATEDGRAAARAAFDAAGARVFASSHTCLPLLQGFGGGRVVVNNGAAGMPNFRNTRFGLATRISVRARPGALHRVRADGLHVEAHCIHYDHAAWLARFLELWPRGSPAHRSYYARLTQGPGHERWPSRRAA